MEKKKTLFHHLIFIDGRVPSTDDTHTHTATNVSAYFQVGAHRISLTFQSNGGADSFYFFNFPIGYCGNDFRLFTKMFLFLYIYFVVWGCCCINVVCLYGCHRRCRRERDWMWSSAMMDHGRRLLIFFFKDIFWKIGTRKMHITSRCVCVCSRVYLDC